MNLAIHDSPRRPHIHDTLWFSIFHRDTGGTHTSRLANSNFYYLRVLTALVSTLRTLLVNDTSFHSSSHRQSRKHGRRHGPVEVPYTHRSNPNIHSFFLDSTSRCGDIGGRWTDKANFRLCGRESRSKRRELVRSGVSYPFEDRRNEWMGVEIGRRR